MRISIVGGLAGPGAIAGGVWRVAESQFDLLSSEHQVFLFGGWLGPTPPRSPSSPSYARLRSLFPGARLRGLWSLAWPLQFARVARRSEVVHIHLSRDYFTTTALAVSVVLRRPVVAQTHGMLRPAANRPLVGLFDLLARPLYLRGVKRWLSLGVLEDRDLIAFGVDQRKIVRIFNASTDLSDLANACARPEIAPPHFTFISRLAPRKQPLVFLRAALRYLETNEASFTIAGPDGGELAELIQVLESQRERSRIVLRKDLDRAGVARELLRSTALVLPSLNEVFPIIALEAMTMSTPLIITEQSEISDVIKRKSAGIVIQPTEDGILEAMLYATRHPSALAEMVRHATNLVRDTWSPAALRVVLEDAYSSVLASRANST